MDILANPWVIGIGSAIVAGLILYFIFGIGKTKPTQRNDKTLGDNLDNSRKSNITSKKITEYLRTVPPAQKKIVAKKYKGIKVSWKVNLETIRGIGGGKSHLMMLNEGEYPWVTCNVNTKLYPELNIIDSKKVFRIDGEINEVDVGTIKLINCPISF